MWYTASAFFKGEHIASGQDTVRLWEEVLLLVEALDEEAAASHAAELARRREHQYTVSQPGEALRWTFVKIERVQALEGPLTNGAEIFSRFLRPGEAESLLTPFDDDRDSEKA
jgi:hypothetical protein